MTTRWGILATGRIAKTLGDAVVASATGELVAVGSRSQASAEAFATNYDGLTAHETYQGLIDDPDVDALYVATPHPQHAEWTIKALEAGKAVLCEKPMAVNHPQVMAMVQKATDTQTFLMEAFMYRTHPQTRRLIELLREGAIGEIRHIHASFGFHAPFNAQHRLFANDLAGGGIMDVGCYPVSMARLIADAEPERVSGHGRLGELRPTRSPPPCCTFQTVSPLRSPPACSWASTTPSASLAVRGRFTSINLGCAPVNGRSL